MLEEAKPDDLCKNTFLIDLEKMTTEEKKLIEQLKNEVGKGCILV